ncbi:MAG: molybdenum cofactor biosynthesis protein MoaB [Phycisphaerales bacterium]|nr:molybdenum cofactor biosynthesis protein MoaB [Phycisphaerales bacterium]
MSHQDHQDAARERQQAGGLRCGVLTCSDSRTTANDRSGDRIVELLEAEDHSIAVRTLTREDPEAIGRSLDELLDAELDLIVCTGGTGIAPRDGTIEVLEQRLTTELPGFGELFRSLSHQEIGAAAMLSRATGGVARTPTKSTLLFALPGSTPAIELGMRALILPQLAHMHMLLHPDQ